MARVFILWSEKYNTGISIIDEQHKKLLSILNSLYESFVERTSNEKIKEVIKEMADYTEYHFGVEEKYFKEFGYEDTEAHLAQHRYYVDKIKEFQKDIEKGNVSITFKIMNFLRSWLIDHINGTDRKYIALFKENGL